VVITLHDYFTACPNGGFFNYPKREVCTLRAMSAACVTTNCDKRSYAQKLWRTTRQWVQKHRGRVPLGVGHFITVSEFSERILRPYLPSGSRTHRVPNPVFIQQGPPVNPNMNESFVFAGRLDPEKGPMLFAEAAAQTGVTAVFVGDGMCSEGIRRKCPSAVVTGWVGRDQVIRHLRQARALAFPSLWYETFGLTVAEAAALGVPAIVSEDSAAAELVEDGITGLHVRTGDVGDFCAKLRLLSDGQTATLLGHAAYDRYWAAPTTIEHHLDHLERVYGKILS
jgi:glycosyltransferase involved in cell wall biosynthesis